MLIKNEKKQKIDLNELHFMNAEMKKRILFERAKKPNNTELARNYKWEVLKKRF